MTSKKSILELCTHKQKDCIYFTPVFPVGFEDLYLSEPNYQFVHNTNDNYMLFVLSGEIKMTFGKFQNKIFEGGEMFFLPRNMSFLGTVIKPSHIALLKYNGTKFECMEDRIRLLIKKKAEGNYSWDKVSLKPELRQCVEELIHYRKHGLSCNHIYLVKSQEIYLIFKHFYTDEERIQVYYPFIGQDPNFSESVMSNYMYAKTAEELAARLGYGIKTFRELFKENFGETPYKWMQKQMAQQLKSRLMKKEIPFKQIMLEFRFTTTSHFITFCRKHFGGTPTEIRNGKLLDEQSLLPRNGEKI
ncbi:AraC family transcriptional regulator [Bacteroides intestinalis]|jgi:AraC-like DNA-binding protein|uniref:AraC family transcriptional regulator n=1 Tax=Bacteroides intestinalis TaxID=329854 RepID=A0A414LFS1_9BACE|nr:MULTISPECIES: helix-turn-helix domain-containing protein [Bacteroides]RHE93492.1 AraC family transcriptional regulator [Bacteroides intestinalis]RHL09385.1 AraC family transcriptional regulator [Bacteroides sp. AF39-11AC]